MAVEDMTESVFEQLDKKFDDLEKSLYLAFLAAPAHERNAFTGVNQRRRRNERITQNLADTMTKKLCQLYLFYRGDEVVSEAEGNAWLYKTLIAVPDAEAKACGAKFGDEKEEAQKKLAADLFAGMMAQWRSVFSPKHLR